MRSPFGDFYRNKTVLVTGNTGFKGSWLTLWLLELGARAVGYALEPPTAPSNFRASRLQERITHVHGDVRDYERLEGILRVHRPEIVFHLAAQPLVRQSLREPRLTFEVNLMGTVNVLEAARRNESVRAAVLITSDKCYRNHEWEWGYRETDELGGHDPYGASKACAELAIAAYQDPRFQSCVDPFRDLPVASARAGNVIGGGDWALDRIVPDTIKAIASGRDVVIRNPHATRPWQHVLEPLSGYLWLGAVVGKDGQRYCSSWNFGPGEGRGIPVAELVQGILSKWPAPTSRLVVESDTSEAESLLLRLDCSKAQSRLGWRCTWDIDRTLDATVAWYRSFYQAGADMAQVSAAQIADFTEAAQSQGITWAQPGNVERHS